MTSDTVLRGLVVILVLVAVLIVVSYYFNRSSEQSAEQFRTNYSSFDGYAPPAGNIAPQGAFALQPPAVPAPAEYESQAQAAGPSYGVNDFNPADLGAGDTYHDIDFPVQTPPTSNTGCFPKDSVSAEDLLPKDAANSTWSQAMPSGQGDISNKNFLTAGYHVGLSSSVLRNANYGLRSEPPNPRRVVSPWGNTTIDPDLMRKPLEVESGNQCD